MEVRKIECRLERWWINSCLLSGDHWCSLYGDIYGHPEHRDGQFVALPVDRADFVRLVAETPEAIIKLGEPMTLDGALGKLNAMTDEKEGDKK